MSKKYGPLNFKNLGKNNFDNFGKFNINQDIIQFVLNVEKMCFEILNNHKESLIKIADLLLDRETIDYFDFNNIIDYKLENSIKIDNVNSSHENESFNNLLNLFNIF